ncbi:MAG: helix-turn-helix domain-containing protein [Streptosporangiaceae bacterium]
MTGHWYRRSPAGRGTDLFDEGDRRRGLCYSTTAQARKSRGLTQRDVAAAMGLSVGRVSQIERGGVTSVEVLGRYADAAGGRLRVVIDFGDELIAV